MSIKQVLYHQAILPALVFAFEQWLTHNIIEQLRESLLIKGSLMEVSGATAWKATSNKSWLGNWATLKLLFVLKALFKPYRSQKSTKIIFSPYSKGKEILLPCVKTVKSWNITTAATCLSLGFLEHMVTIHLSTAHDELVKKGEHSSLLVFSPSLITNCLGS